MEKLVRRTATTGTASRPSPLEETDYHRLNPAQGYGHQLVFTEDGALDETITVHDHEVVLAPTTLAACRTATRCTIST